MTDDITKLENARVLKQMGAPLDTPVEERVCSLDYSRHWFALMDARDKFMVAVGEYAGSSPRAGSPCKWRLVRRRHTALDKAARRCVDLLGRLQDVNERAILKSFLDQRAGPFIRFWADAIDAVDGGTPLTIRPGDIPPWEGDLPFVIDPAPASAAPNDGPSGRDRTRST